MSLAQKPPFKFTSSIGRLKADANAVQNQLRIISNAIDTIYQRSSSQLSFNEIYGTAYNLVLQKQGDALYDRIQETCAVHLSHSVARIVSSEGTSFLQTLAQEWTIHSTAFESIARVLMYMDRTYCDQKKKADSLTLMLSLFRDRVVYVPEIRHTLRQQLLTQILQERQGNIIDRSLLREILLMMARVSVQCAVSVYEEDFEQFFLAETEQFYREESLAFITTHTCPEYMTKVTRRLAEESERLTNYLATETEPKLRAILEQQLLTTHIRTLIDMEHTGILALYRSFQPNIHGNDVEMASSAGSVSASALLLSGGGGGGSSAAVGGANASTIEDLKRFFLLFGRVVPCFAIIYETLGKEIVRRGQEILSSQETARDPVAFVKDVLHLKDQYDGIVQLAYRHDKRLEAKVKEAFKSFINNDHRTAAHLSAYLDDFFRKAMQGLSETDINTQLDKVIVIFRFLSDKDVFEDYYNKALSKRLLGQKTVADDQEKLMIAKLKNECGLSFTTKMEGMFMDMNLSKAVMDVYRASAYPSRLAPWEMDVQVLTMGHWSVTSVPCRLSTELDTMQQTFTEFYTNEHSGRKLTWCPSLGYVEMRGNFPLGKKEFTVSSFQWCILALFNLQDTWTFAAIHERLAMPTLELRRHLLSLCTSKLPILKKTSSGKVRASVGVGVGVVVGGLQLVANCVCVCVCCVCFTCGAVDHRRTRGDLVQRRLRVEAAAYQGHVGVGEGRATVARHCWGRQRWRRWHWRSRWQQRWGRHRRNGLWGQRRGHPRRSGRPSTVSNRSRHRPHHEGAQDARAQRVDRRGHAAAVASLLADRPGTTPPPTPLSASLHPPHHPSSPAVDSQMHRTAHRAGLHPARPGGLASVQLRRLGLTPTPRPALAPNHHSFFSLSTRYPRGAVPGLTRARVCRMCLRALYVAL